MTLPDADAPLRSPEALLDDLIAEFERHYQDADAEPIRRAFEAANEAHLGQTRKSGEPFIIHPLIATEILAGYGMDGDPGGVWHGRGNARRRAAPRHG
jgi:(p)ppGpp synthase/HD superfamily hydrolase